MKTPYSQVLKSMGRKITELKLVDKNRTVDEDKQDGPDRKSAGRDIVAKREHLWHCLKFPDENLLVG